MITIYWKEIRENLKWAALIMVVFGFFVFLAVSQGRELYPSELADVLFIFGAAGAGLLMGLFQIVFEAWTDKWAFLIHRPVSRTRMFLGKMLAGWTLLLLALGIPWIVSVIWSVMPEHRMAPFYWQMLLPPIGDILSSFIYWFAGMLIGLRSARWYVSRIFPIAFPLLCSLFIWIIPEFWQALLVILIGGSVMCLAAWGAFQSGGAYTSQPHLARPFLAASLFPAIAIIVLFAAAMGMQLLRLSGRSYDGWNYNFTSTGTPVRVRWQFEFDHGKTTVTDMDGRPIERYRDIESGSDEAQADFLEFTYLPLKESPRSFPGPALGYRGSRRYYAELYPHSRSNIERSLTPDNEKWLYCYPERIMRGYEWTHQRFIGFIGPSGFSPAADPPAERFPEREFGNRASPYYEYTSTDRFLLFPTVIYEMELREHRVRSILTTSIDDPIVYIRESPDKSPLPFMFVVTRKHIRMLDDQNRQVFITNVPAEAARYATAMIGRISQSGNYLLRLSNPNGLTQMQDRGEEHVLELAADGTLVRQFDLPPLPPAIVHSWTWTAEPAIAGAIIPASVLALGKAASMASSNELFSGGFVRELFAVGAPSFLLATVISALVSAGVATWMCRRYALTGRRTVTWAISALLLGPMGVLLMWCLLDWPAREACPICSKKRVVTRESCEHCAAPFPSPQPEPADIFA